MRKILFAIGLRAGMSHSLLAGTWLRLWVNPRTLTELR
jgi:hypothetical protein